MFLHMVFLPEDNILIWSYCDCELNSITEVTARRLNQGKVEKYQIPYEEKHHILRLHVSSQLTTTKNYNLTWRKKTRRKTEISILFISDFIPGFTSTHTHTPAPPQKKNQLCHISRL